MGIFDSKEVKEAKIIYKELIAIKDSSKILRDRLPKTEKEFLKNLNFYAIKDMIGAYKYAKEIIKRADILQTFKLNNLGEVYDFISDYYVEYSVEFRFGKNRTEMSFMEYLEKNIAQNLALHKAEEYIESTKKEITKIQNETNEAIIRQEQLNEDMEQRINNLNHSPSAIRANELAQEGAKELFFEIEQKKFDQKFPEYSKLKHMVMLYDLGVMNEETRKQINDIITMGKEYYEEFELKDMLMPYLEEKSHAKILTDKTEKDIFYSKVGYDTEAARKLIIALMLNAIFFHKEDKRKREMFIKSFECKKINHFYSPTNKDELIREIEMSSISRNGR